MRIFLLKTIYSEKINEQEFSNLLKYILGMVQHYYDEQIHSSIVKMLRLAKDSISDGLTTPLTDRKMVIVDKVLPKR